MRIALSTGGGDAPGLNAVIRGAVLAAVNRGWAVYGIQKGFGGLLGNERVLSLGPAEVRGITHVGGTILGTTNRADPFRWPVTLSDGTVREVDRSDELIAAFRAHGFDALITIGGDGSLRIALKLFEKGLPVIGVPKTIDNDVSGTVLRSTQTFRTDGTRRVLFSPVSAMQTPEFMEQLHSGFKRLRDGGGRVDELLLIPAYVPDFLPRWKWKNGPASYPAPALSGRIPGRAIHQS